MTTRWTWSWSAPEPAGRCSPSAWPAPGGASCAWTPVRSGTPTPTGSATNAARTPCTGPNRARSVAVTPYPWARTTPGAEWAGRWSITPGTPRVFTPPTSGPTPRDGVGADWPIDYADLQPYYAALEQELPVAGQDWPWGDPHTYPHHPHPVSGNGEIFLRGAGAAGIEARVGPVAIPNGRFGNRPHCIYRGFCLQGCKVNAKASPLITHIPDALAHGAEIRPDSHVTRVVVDDRTGAVTGVNYLRAGREHSPARPGGGGLRLLHRDPAAAAALRHRPVPARSGQRPRPGRALPDGARRTPDRRPLRRRDPHVQVTPARGVLRTVLRNRPHQALQARLVHPDRQPAAHHLGRTRRRSRTLGRPAARVHARLRPLGHPRRTVRVPAATRQPGHPRRREGPPRPAGRALLLHPVRQRQAAHRSRDRVDGSRSCTRPGPARS